MQNTKGKDKIERRVSAAMDAVRSGGKLRLAAAFVAMSRLETGDVISELILCVEDATDGVDTSALLEAANFPDKLNAAELLTAALSCDLGQMQTAVGSDRLDKVLPSLLVLATGLTDARKQLQGNMS